MLRRNKKHVAVVPSLLSWSWHEGLGIISKAKVSITQGSYMYFSNASQPPDFCLQIWAEYYFMRGDSIMTLCEVTYDHKWRSCKYNSSIFKTTEINNTNPERTVRVFWVNILVTVTNLPYGSVTFHQPPFVATVEVFFSQIWLNVSN